MATRMCFCFGNCIRLCSWPFSRLAIWSHCQRQSRRRAIFADLLIWMNKKSPSEREVRPPVFSFFHDLSSLLSPSSSSDSQLLLLLLVLTLARASSSLLGAWCNSRIDSARRGHAEITGRIVSRSVYFGNQTAAAWKLKPRRAHV